MAHFRRCLWRCRLLRALVHPWLCLYTFSRFAATGLPLAVFLSRPLPVATAALGSGSVFGTVSPPLLPALAPATLSCASPGRPQRAYSPSPSQSTRSTAVHSTPFTRLHATKACARSTRGSSQPRSALALDKCTRLQPSLCPPSCTRKRQRWPRRNAHSLLTPTASHCSYITLYETTKSRMEPHCQSEVLRNISSGGLASAVSQVSLAPYVARPR